MPEKLDYGPILADLERQRIEIEQAIATLRRVAGLPQEARAADSPGSDGASPGIGLNPHLFFGMKVPEAVKAYLAIVKRPQTATKIAQELVAHGLHSSSDSPSDIVRTALRRMNGAEVVQVKKEWGLTEWFPGLKNKRTRKNTDENDNGSETVKADPKGKGKAVKKQLSGARRAYLDFISRRLRDGASMGEAQAEWKERKRGEG